MISTARSDTGELLYHGLQDIPSAPRTWSIEALPSNRKNAQDQVISPIDSLTVHHHPHILDKTINDFEGLCGSYLSLILCEPIQPLEYCIDLLLSEKLPKKFSCVVFSLII